MKKSNNKVNYRCVFTPFFYKVQKFSYLFILPILLATGCGRREKKDKPETEKKISQMGHSMKMNEDNSIKTKVAILVFPGVELLDFSGPMEVFNDAKGFQVYTVSSAGKNIATQNNRLKLEADYTIEDAPQPDILVLPGGHLEVLDSVANKQVIKWIKQVNEKTEISISVCTGALFLSKSGLLDGKKATSHLGAIDTLQKLNPKVNYLHDGRFVQDGKIVTSAGVSAGIDGALHVVEILKGLKTALFVTSIMEYEHWDPKDGLIVNGDLMEQAKEKENPSMQIKNAETTDVVCGMSITGKNSKYYTVYEGKEYHFCSASCKKLFDQHPKLYVLKSE